MKNSILIIACAILCAACGNKLPTHSMLYGKVKKITIKEYNNGEMLFGEWQPTGTSNYTKEYVFNRKGAIESVKVFKGDKVIGEWEKKYRSETYKYRNGWLAEYKRDDYSEHTEFADGKPTKTIVISEGEISGIYLYSNILDHDNYTMEEYSPDGRELRERRVIVDGRVVELSNVEAPYIATAKYDERGNAIESENCNFGEFGNIEFRRWNTERNKYSYTYDKQGNWTKRVKFEILRHSNELREIVTREIVYW